MAPLVSVLLPVKEYTPYLPTAINSVLTQSLVELECLVIGNQDINDWAHLLQTDSRLRILRRDNPGIVGALNTGLMAAKGQYIARMDADDVSLPTRFDTQLNYLQQHPEISIAGAVIEFFVDEGRVQAGNLIYQNWLNSLKAPTTILDNLYVESPLPHPTLFASTGVFKQLAGYRDTEWAEDYDLLLRANSLGMKMGKPSKILFRWRDHTNRLTRIDSRYSKANFTRAKAWAISETVVKNREVIICGTGRNAAQLHDALLHFGAKVQCFVEMDEARTRTSKRHLPVITYRELLGAHQQALIVSAVSARGARDHLRQLFTSLNLKEGRDFLMAA